MARYIIRAFRDQEQSGSTSPGTILEPVASDLSFYVNSADEAEERLYEETLSGRLPSGRVYQICPASGSSDPIRSYAVGTDGSTERVFLDSFGGIHASLKRIRMPKLESNRRIVPEVQNESLPG